jgi:hypothetical protein
MEYLFNLGENHFWQANVSVKSVDQEIEYKYFLTPNGHPGEIQWETISHNRHVKLNKKLKVVDLWGTVIIYDSVYRKLEKLASSIYDEPLAIPRKIEDIKKLLSDANVTLTMIKNRTLDDEKVIREQLTKANKLPAAEFSTLVNHLFEDKKQGYDPNVGKGYDARLVETRPR